MIIANPIYDVVFRYLMEDAEIAKGLIAKIINEEIVELSFEPQILSSRSTKFDLVILRLDFKATIKTPNGEHKKVLIELQKSKNTNDILRFRKYLAENYATEDVIEGENNSLPIITIYFLGFSLENITTPALKVNRQYFDLINEKQLNVKETFIEKLTHDCYVIQIKRLDETIETELESVLQVFNQTYISKDKKLLLLQKTDFATNELVQLMIDRLGKAASDKALLKQIEVEEEVENTIESHIRDKHKLEEKIVDLQDSMSKKDRELSEKDKLIEELKKQLKNKK